MWPKQAQFMVRASVRASDYNLPHWKAGTIAFGLAIAMRGETRTQVVYRFVSFLPCFYYWTFLFLFCFVFSLRFFLFPAKNIELHIWQWFLTNRTLLHSQSWVNLPFCFLYDRKNKREREREKTKRMEFSTEAKETRGPGSLSKPVRRFLSYLWRYDTMYYLWLVWAWYYSV